MKVIENFVHEGTIYKIGMVFSGSPTDELLPFLENISADIQDEKVLEESQKNIAELSLNDVEINKTAEQLSNNSEKINISDERQNQEISRISPRKKKK
jgi:hypothetical protein